VGQRHYPINYPLKDIGLYLLLAVWAYIAMRYTRGWGLWPSLATNTLLILLFLAVIIRRDLPLSQLPVVGKYFNRGKKRS